MKDNIVIVGGGIAGMEAARQLLLLGYKPILVEKSDHLGGHVADWHCLFPDLTPAKEVIASLASQIKEANIFLETEVSFINKMKMGYNVMFSNGVNVICKAILLATGFDLFDASKKEEYGYGIYDQVMTNKDLEHWFNTGDDKRITGKDIKKIGFVHCVGSRDVKAGNQQCSKVCCITAIKQAMEMKERFPDAEVYCFYMDLRLFGKKYEDFYIKAQMESGVHFIRGRVSEVSENLQGKVIVKTEDTLSGKPAKITLDLLVLMAGIVCNRDAVQTASMVQVPIDSDGFLKSRDNILNIIETDSKGVFLAGTATGAKTIPETAAEARAVALAIHNYLVSQQ